MDEGPREREIPEARQRLGGTWLARLLAKETGPFSRSSPTRAVGIDWPPRRSSRTPCLSHGNAECFSLLRNLRLMINIIESTIDTRRAAFAPSYDQEAG